MQIFVTGMHRSGTSMTCRLINMMGAYFGTEGCQPPPDENNPRGSWERHDVRALNDDLLSASGATWSNTDPWSMTHIPHDQLEQFKVRAQHLVFKLESFRPWVIKDQLFCFTYPLYRKYLEMPVVVLVARRPDEVAQSLHDRGGIPVSEGLELWRQYVSSALELTRDCPRVIIRYDNLLENPVLETRRLFAELRQCGVQGLRMPEAFEVEQYVDPELYRSKPEGMEVPEDIAKLYETLLDAYL